MKKIFSRSTLLFLAAIAVFYFGKKIYMMPKYDDGEMAPAFSGPMPDGSTFQLSDLKGYYVLVDFWGSWCFPCKAESPHIIDLYQKFNGRKFKDARGFEVVGVAIDKDENRWKRAIGKWGLPWKYQVIDLNSNFKFFDAKIAGAFGVKEVPTKFLINPEGRIVGVNQSAEEIATYLSNHLE
ncbi:MAG: TlpA family protein disulfide reductase [Bacteroidetes bacterium]|nr:MAG: TlpA family protein disulfide reductase [Bacteroidota bacterium]